MKHTDRRQIQTIFHYRQKKPGHRTGPVWQSIDPVKCKGCSKCARNCPASAIHGTLKSPYTIAQDACIRCGSCVEQCAFGAITVEK